ncbi:hypothetical protein SBA_ch1_03920 [Sphingomonas bisphenolicum]|uniref:Uncharacterized protein n=1 Tax=Sphingomonas bisphenolicum TaxID=296544 RepID=A0ABN5WG21_9SPHN|nr:hypothetical protein SBA_ch1_03920 [Sphingomonas bisphenolicum]
MREFGAHQAGNAATDDARDDREDQVEGADVLMVGGHEPALEEGWLMIGIVMIVIVGVVAVMICGDGCHGFLP